MPLKPLNTNENIYITIYVTNLQQCYGGRGGNGSDGGGKGGVVIMVVVVVLCNGWDVNGSDTGGDWKIGRAHV